MLDTCLLIFIADVVTGVQAPLFPLYTTSLGASLWLLGLITAVLGVTRVLSSVPVGMLSDRLDRKTVLVGGMIMFGLSFVGYAIVPNAGWLVAPRVLQAIATVATFPLGIAYIGDVVEPRDRGAAVGVYTAAMGLGFAVGPLIGSWVASTAGYPAAYITGAFIAFLGAAFGAARLIRKKAISDTSSVLRLRDLPAFAALVRQPVMVMACVANIVMMLSMTGAILTYFPVYAHGIGLSTVAIGTLFAWRGFASAFGRIPMGPLSSRLPVAWILAAVLVVEATINLAISRTPSPVALAALLVLEGIAYGVFMVSGQLAVASQAGQANSGAALGLFWMAGSIGDLFGPIALGVVAQEVGVVTVFQAVAGAVVLGAVAVAYLGVLAANRTRRETRQQFDVS